MRLMAAPIVAKLGSSLSAELRASLASDAPRYASRVSRNGNPTSRRVVPRSGVRLINRRRMAFTRDFERCLKLLFLRHLHVGVGEAELDVLLVSQGLAVGEFD